MPKFADADAEPGKVRDYPMRIQRHLSILLFVSAIGAIGLMTVVGVLLGGIELAVRAMGTASEQQQQVAVLRAQGGVLLEHSALGSLTRERAKGQSVWL